MFSLTSHRILSIIRLLRPHQWLKSVFVFAGILFAHKWNNGVFFERALLAALAFSLVASAIYIINDIVDCESDKSHPAKKHRPIASGEVNIPFALVCGLMVGSTGISIGYVVSSQVANILWLYIGLNIAYSFYFKNVRILDVVIISMGFLLRVLAGTTGIGIFPSSWLLICTLLLTLFLGFTKRYADNICLPEKRSSDKKMYSQSLLRMLIGISAVGSILSYTFYTIKQDHLLHHGYRLLIFTVPLVIAGICRYLYLIHQRQHCGLDIAYNIFSDLPLLSILISWILIIFYLF